MNEDLLGYVLNVDDAADRAQIVDRLATDPDLARQVERVERLVAPLALDRDTIEPPGDLVMRTIGRVAEHLGQTSCPATPAVECVSTRLAPEQWRAVVANLDRPSGATRGRRANWVVALSLAILAMGIGLAGLPYLRYRQNVQSCQNQLRQVYGSLETYADTHDGKYPQVGERPPYETAASFLAILRDSGAAPAGKIMCPASGPPYPSGYAYTLGYRDEADVLHGLQRDHLDEAMALAADRPIQDRSGSGRDHRYGQNVLFAGGHVRFCSSPNVGPDRDDIYLNQRGFAAAGVHWRDSVLGVGTDRP